MSDWHYAEEKPTERLCRVEHYSMLKQQVGGDVEFLITVREYVNPPDPAMRFLAQADKQTNQKSAPYTPTGWGSSLLQALAECMKGIQSFPMSHKAALAILVLVGCGSFAQEAASDPWAAGELLQPAELARAIQSGKAPVLLSVAFPVLYKGRHILHAINAGPTSKPEGIEALKTAVAKLPKDADLVIYCGCCPMVKCPNIRPAYRTLKELGFTHVRVLSLATNLHTDWVSKDYPSEGPN